MCNCELTVERRQPTRIAVIVERFEEQAKRGLANDTPSYTCNEKEGRSSSFNRVPKVTKLKYVRSNRI